MIIYSADKFNLFYQWKRPPALDSTLATRSRNFLTISICSHVIMSRIFFAVRHDGSFKPTLVHGGWERRDPWIQAFLGL